MPGGSEQGQKGRGVDLHVGRGSGDPHLSRGLAGLTPSFTHAANPHPTVDHY